MFFSPDGWRDFEDLSYYTHDVWTIASWRQISYFTEAVHAKAVDGYLVFAFDNDFRKSLNHPEMLRRR